MYSKKQVQKAGQILIKQSPDSDEYNQAMIVLSYWRGLYHYPLMIFNSLLRNKVKQLGLDDAIIAQRLKRTPSIIKKLKRFGNMSLARMQDIAGLRVVVNSIDDVYRLHQSILLSRHEALLPANDYIAKPKADGYRSLHQVFKYKTKQDDGLDGLQIELQIRTKLQHAWATAVETLGLLQKASFKTGEWTDDYAYFFKLASALFSLKECQPVLDEFAGLDKEYLIGELIKTNERLQIFSKLQGLILTAKHSDTKADYHLMELDLSKSSVNLIGFSHEQSDIAQSYYKSREMDTKDNPDIELVLISVGSINDIKKAYPNYFLDTHVFIKELKDICQNKP